MSGIEAPITSPTLRASFSSSEAMQSAVEALGMSGFDHAEIALVEPVSSTDPSPPEAETSPVYDEADARQARTLHASGAATAAGLAAAGIIVATGGLAAVAVGAAIVAGAATLSIRQASRPSSWNGTPARRMAGWCCRSRCRRPRRRPGPRPFSARQARRTSRPSDGDCDRQPVVLMNAPVTAAMQRLSIQMR
jgi:hypothetical protein